MLRVSKKLFQARWRRPYMLLPVVNHEESLRSWIFGIAVEFRDPYVHRPYVFGEGRVHTLFRRCGTIDNAICVKGSSCLLDLMFRPPRWSREWSERLCLPFDHSTHKGREMILAPLCLIPLHTARWVRGEYGFLGKGTMWWPAWTTLAL